MSKAKHTGDASQLVADAIDVIHRFNFVPGAKTRGAGPAVFEYLRAIAAGSPGGVHLRVFQKHGITSKDVAKALRANVLAVVEVPR